MSDSVIRGAPFLDRLPAPARHRLRAQAHAIELAAGVEVYREADAPRVMVLVRGMARAVIRSDDGREVAVRHAGPGDVIGLATLVGGPGPMSLVTVTAVRILVLPHDLLRMLIATDAGVADAVAAELGRELLQAFEDAGAGVLLNVRQRVARRLLDLARPAMDGRLVAQITHRELADSIGASRESVSRSLTSLRLDGLVATARGRIELRDPEALARA